MAIKILAGDYPKGSTLNSTFGSYWIKFPGLNLDQENIELASIDAITEENVKKFIGAAGWGFVGSVVLGPLGLLSGVLKGGNKKNVLVACETKSGKKFLVEVDSKTYKKMLASVF